MYFVLHEERNFWEDIIGMQIIGLTYVISRGLCHTNSELYNYESYQILQKLDVMFFLDIHQRNLPVCGW